MQLFEEAVGILFYMHGTVVGVLRGGPSREHDVSLASGAAILQNLSKEHYSVRDLYIDREGTWHERGLPTSPDRVLSTVDVVVNGLHGEYGEDGEVQKVLDRYSVPYTGSDSFASYIAMHKVLTKELAKRAGVLTPRYVFIESEEGLDLKLAEVVRTFPQPVVVKPVKWGSSVGVTLTTGLAPLQKAVRALLQDAAGGVLIEERIRGVEATAGVIEGLRGEELYALPPIEIVPPSNDFFSYDAKYTGKSQEICPGRFTKPVSEELVSTARLMHEALGLRHYSRSDFMVSPKGIYFLETNTLPGLTSESLLPKSLAAVGVGFPEFLDHLVALALQTKKR